MIPATITIILLLVIITVTSVIVLTTSVPKATVLQGPCIIAFGAAGAPCRWEVHAGEPLRELNEEEPWEEMSSIGCMVVGFTGFMYSGLV